MRQSPLPARFRDVEAIGSGAQGQTFRAHDDELDRDVAVKVLRLRESDDWKAFDRFERECAVLGSLEHPGVPRYLAHFADEGEGAYYLVMELVEGRSLASDIAEQRRRTEDQLRGITEQLLDVLVYLHELHPRVIHRDIKPANVIQRHDGRVVLVDFGGVALPFRSRGASTMIGTFGYMAPEQLYGKATPATDLYALGATMAALAAGIDGEELPRRGHVIDLEEILRPGHLRSTLEAMLASDPDARPASAREARGMLAGEVSLPVADSRALEARPETNAIARDDGSRELAPGTIRERRLVSATLVVGTALTVATRAPLLLLLVVFGLLAYFAVSRGEEA